MICRNESSRLSVCLSVWPSVCLSDCLSVCLSVSLSLCLSFSPSACLPVWPPGWLSVCQCNKVWPVYMWWKREVWRRYPPILRRKRPKATPNIREEKKSPMQPRIYRKPGHAMELPMESSICWKWTGIARSGKWCTLTTQYIQKINLNWSMVSQWDIIIGSHSLIELKLNTYECCLIYWWCEWAHPNQKKSNLSQMGYLPKIVQNVEIVFCYDPECS